MNWLLVKFSKTLGGMPLEKSGDNMKGVLVLSVWEAGEQETVFPCLLKGTHIYPIELL